jgi:dihydroflavonol-4-reductase
VRIPYAAGLAYAYLSEFWSDRVTGSMPQATVTGVRLTRRTMKFDAHKSLQFLDLNPREVRRSLTDAVTWLREKGEVPPVGGL